MNEEVVAWLKLFCKKSFYLQNTDAPNYLTVMEKRIGTNMIATIMWSDKDVLFGFRLVVNKNLIKCDKTTPWLFIHDIADMKLNLNAMMSRAYGEVFDKVCGTGIEQLRKI